MHQEITVAAAYIARYLQRLVDEKQLDQFYEALCLLMQQKYTSATWNPLVPYVGSAYRALVFQNGIPDSLVRQAAISASIPSIEQCFPYEMTLWVDPCCVAFRLGDHGYISTIHDSSTTESEVTRDYPGQPYYQEQYYEHEKPTGVNKQILVAN